MSADNPGGFALPDLTQVGVIVRDLDKAIEYYSNKLGIGPWRVLEGDIPNAQVHAKPAKLRLKIALARMGPVVDFELIEVPPGASIYREFLESRGEGLHHLGFRVADFDAELARMEGLGFKMLQGGGIKPTRHAYMDTDREVGVICELIERQQRLAPEK